MPERMGVISDVHGNLEALRAVLGDMGPVDLLLCLGDVVGYGAQPNEVIRLLRERGAVVLRGNHEEGVLTGETGWFNEWAAEAIRWTRTVLTPESRAHLEGLPLRWEGRLGERTIGAVHGSFRDPLYEYVVGLSTARACFEAAPQEALLVGHTHRAVAYTFREDRLEWGLYPEGGVHPLRDRVLLNPGSVGQPRDGNPRASYGILEGDTFHVKRVEYDIAGAQEKIRRAGLPEFLAGRLEMGR
ncbi:MAG: metallophosphoesterase family protein [Euryarchaeota archaeon]|nr:metallophosphoesterase family protein [Euryarchaeota archaeon]